MGYYGSLYWGAVVTICGMASGNGVPSSVAGKFDVV